MRINSIIEEFRNKTQGEQLFILSGSFAPFLIGVSWTKNDKNGMDVLSINKGRKTYSVVSMDKYKGQAQSKLQDLVDGKTNIKKIMTDYNKSSDKIWRLYESFFIKNNPNKNSIKELKGFIKNSAGLVPELSFKTICVEVFDKDVLLDVLGDKDSQNIFLIWDDITLPTFLSFENRRNNFIFDSIVKHGLEGAVDYARYIYTDYFSAKDKTFVLRQIKKLHGRKKEVKKEIDRQNLFIKNNVEKIYKHTKKLSKKQKMLVEYVGLVMKLRDLRKDAYAQAQTVLYMAAVELFKKLGLPKKDIVLFLPHEVILFNKERIKQVKSEAKKRSKGMLFLNRPNNTSAVSAVAFNDTFKVIDNLVHGKQSEATEIKGSTAFRGIARGIVKIVVDTRNANFRNGEILVTSMTRPEFVPLIKKALAIITNEGGITCHAAIISRELKKPCIIGTKIATRVLKDGDLVEVDAERGIVKILQRKKK